MNLLKDDIRVIYFRYLFPSLFSGLIMSIYSLVDMIVVGQYEGSAGTAALACIAPFWTFFCCLSVLFGNGGAVLFSTAKGEGNVEESKAAFTVSFILISLVTAIVWISIILFDEQLLRLFGADDALFPLAVRYMRWLKWGIPLWPIGYFLGMFVRNDGSPGLAGIATICGGVLNICGDFFLTFTCNMGIEGAAIATVAGQGIAFLLQFVHFFRKKNTISFVVITSFVKRSKEVVTIGFSSFVCSVGMGIMVILFNNQIRRYFGNNELAVYGVAANIFMLIQTFSYGIGNAAQPIVAENLGAGKDARVIQTRRMGSLAAIVIGSVATTVTVLFPGQIIRLYMDASREILEIAPGILRNYFICLFFVPFNVFATYYLQAVQRVKESVIVSVLRGFVLGSIFVCLFPSSFGPDAIWSVMLSTECITAFLVMWMFKKKRCGKENNGI